MRFQIIFVLGFIALASASPLVDKKGSSLKVIDIPADLFAEASENVEAEKKPEEIVVADSPAAAADTVPAIISEPEKDVPVPPVKIAEEIPPPAVEITEPKGDDKKDEVSTIGEKNEGEDGERPGGIFGFRLPTIVILRRPAVFDDPFSFFPFSISSFNRRPTFGGAIPPSDNRELEDPRPVTSAAAVPSEQRPVSVGGNNAGIADIMHGVRQHMDSLFSSLFAPNPGFYNNRPQFFSRPFFPSVPADSSAEEDGIDFDKLPNDYKNSTSETKVVDGQVIEVNKTVHKIGGNNSNGFFQFSVIKIRPSDAPVTNETPVEAPKDIPPVAIEAVEEKRESTTKAQEAELNNPSLNEVFDQEEKEAMMANTKYETDPGLLEPNVPVALPLTEEVIYDFVPVKSMPIIEAQTTKGSTDGKYDVPHDLSSDLRVNNLMANADSGRLRSLVDPDEIEVIEV